jgi:Predicted amidohydrolase
MEKYDLTDYTLPQHNYDIILKNGRVIDPASRRDEVMDVAITDGQIAALGQSLPGPCFDIIDCAGKIVIPGFVDAHTHCYPATNMSLPPDTGGVYGGVPTVVDGGSSGYMTFPDFYNRYIKNAITDVYALLHVHPVGQYAHGFGHNIHPEVWNPALFKMQNYRVQETVDQYRDRIVGLKNRGIETFIEHKGVVGLEEQLQLATKCGLPYSIHIGEAHGEHLSDDVIDNFTQAVLERLRPGDIIAHAFTNKRGRLFRKDGKYDYLIRQAVDRGVLLDACVGKTNFSLEAFNLALERSYKPNIISSDYTYISIQGVNRHFGLNLSRFVALGLPLMEVLAMATINPAQALNLDDRKARLEVGRSADLSVLDVLKGDYTFMDQGDGASFKGEEILSAYVTIRDGRVYHVIHNGAQTP